MNLCECNTDYDDVTVSYHLVLLVGVCSCLQQSIDSLSMSILGSYTQRNTAILYGYVDPTEERVH